MDTALTVTADKVKEGDDEPFESCLARIHAGLEGLTRLRVTGVYIPPSRVGRIGMRVLAKLVGSHRKDGKMELAPHVFAGVCNPPEWEGLSEEWGRERE